MILAPSYERYRIFVCSDCHPDHIDKDDPEVTPYERPYEVILPVDGELVHDEHRNDTMPLDTCPRCGSHLSFCGEGFVSVQRV